LKAIEIIQNNMAERFDIFTSVIFNCNKLKYLLAKACSILLCCSWKCH